MLRKRKAESTFRVLPLHSGRRSWDLEIQSDWTIQQVRTAAEKVLCSVYPMTMADDHGCLLWLSTPIDLKPLRHFSCSLLFRQLLHSDDDLTDCKLTMEGPSFVTTHQNPPSPLQYLQYRDETEAIWFALNRFGHSSLAGKPCTGCRTTTVAKIHPLGTFRWSVSDALAVCRCVNLNSSTTRNRRAAFSVSLLPEGTPKPECVEDSSENGLVTIRGPSKEKGWAVGWYALDMVCCLSNTGMTPDQRRLEFIVGSDDVQKQLAPFFQIGPHLHLIFLILSFLFPARPACSLSLVDV